MKKKIAVIGLGYVGLPIAISLCKKHKLVGFDNDRVRINELGHYTGISSLTIIVYNSRKLFCHWVKIFF